MDIKTKSTDELFELLAWIAYRARYRRICNMTRGTDYAEIARWKMRCAGNCIDADSKTAIKPLRSDSKRLFLLPLYSYSLRLACVCTAFYGCLRGFASCLAYLPCARAFLHALHFTMVA